MLYWFPDNHTGPSTMKLLINAWLAGFVFLTTGTAHAGLVTATRGAAGGYRLARPPTAISVAEVVAAIDGDIGLTQCSVHAADCARTTYCPTRPHWAAINRAVGAALSAISLAEMMTPFAFVPAPGAFAEPAAAEPRV